MARQSDVAALMGVNPNQVHAVAVTEVRTALADRVPSVVLDVATNKPATYWRVGDEYFLDHPDYPVTNIKDFRYDDTLGLYRKQLMEGDDTT